MPKPFYHAIITIELILCARHSEDMQNVGGLMTVFLFPQKIGIIVNVFKKQKRESHNTGVLFLYTVEISQVHFFADFCPWESKDRATLHKATYPQSDWYS